VLQPGVYVPYDGSAWGHAYSIGADYEVMKNLNAFVSYNQGYVLPTFDDMRNNFSFGDNHNAAVAGQKYDPYLSITRVKQVQGGIKTSQDMFSLYLTGFYANFTGQPASQLLTNGTTVNYTLASNTEGVEADATLHPFRSAGQYLQGLELAFAGTYQHGTYSSGGASINGNEVARQPDFQFRLTPSYTIDTAYGALKIWATTTYVDSRWGDVLDTQFLPSYVTEDIGASFQMENGLEVRFTGTNITNTLAITEGNSRVIGNGTGAGGVFLGRPLFGASYEGSVAIHF